jgi:hypothetical protein
MGPDSSSPELPGRSGTRPLREPLASPIPEPQWVLFAVRLEVSTALPAIDPEAAKKAGIRLPLDWDENLP